MDITHYVPAFAARGICGVIGLHASDPSCPECQQRLDCDHPLTWDIALESDGFALPASPPCLDGSMEACVPSMPLVDVPRCVYCRREMR